MICARCKREMPEISADERYCLKCYFDQEAAQLERDEERGDDE